MQKKYPVFKGKKIFNLIFKGNFCFVCGFFGLGVERGGGGGGGRGIG